MRLFFGIVCFMWMATSAFAAIQYDFGSMSSANASFNNPASGYDAFIDRGGRFGLQNAMYFNQSSYLYVSSLKGSNAIGVYAISGSSISQEYKLVSVGDGYYTAVDAKGKAVNFQAGDAIGFYTEINGQKVYSTPKLEEGHAPNFVGTQVTQNEFSIGFGEYGHYVTSADGYNTMFNESNSVVEIKIGSTNPLPSGQPLPGLLATLAAGGFGVGALRFFKRRK